MGKISATVPHEDGKADYSAEVASLDASGAEVLAVFGYVDQGGRYMIQTSLDTGAFDKFILADGMYGDSLLENIDGDLTGTFEQCRVQLQMVQIFSRRLRGMLA